MSSPTESRTLHSSKDRGPLFDRFKLLVEKAELSRPRENEKMPPQSMRDAHPEARPDFGMTVPPVVERRIEPRKASEVSSFVRHLV